MKPRPALGVWLGIAIALLAIGALSARAATPQPQTSVSEISSEVMCPVCGVPLELAQEAPQAEAERDFIRRLIAEGKTKDEVKDALVAEYGENVLAVPGDDGFGLAAWLIPIAAFLTAAIAIGIALRRWRHTNGSAEPRGDGTAGDAVDVEGAKQLDEDMARYDL